MELHLFGRIFLITFYFKTIPNNDLFVMIIRILPKMRHARESDDAYFTAVLPNLGEWIKVLCHDEKLKLSPVQRKYLDRVGSAFASRAPTVRDITDRIDAVTNAPDSEERTDRLRSVMAELRAILKSESLEMP